MPLIVLEGLDGSGKTTQLNRLYAALEHIGREFIALRDPGGTRLGEQLREILLDPANEVAQTAELFGYLLSRSQLVAERIVPALEQGAAVILDRFWYSTVAYQCFGLGLSRQTVQPAIDLANQGIAADCALYLQISADRALARRAAASGQLDRIESRGAEYLAKVAGGYETLVAEDALMAIDAEQSVDEVAAAIWAQVQKALV
jgi:dTMP kinase